MCNFSGLGPDISYTGMQFLFGEFANTTYIQNITKKGSDTARTPTAPWDVPQFAVNCSTLRVLLALLPDALQ